jgi:hypothetical protein
MLAQDISKVLSAKVKTSCMISVQFSVQTATMFAYDISTIFGANTHNDRAGYQYNSQCKYQNFVHDINTMLTAVNQNLRPRDQHNSQRITAILFAQDMDFHHQQP